MLTSTYGTPLTTVLVLNTSKAWKVTGTGSSLSISDTGTDCVVMAKFRSAEGSRLFCDANPRKTMSIALDDGPWRTFTTALALSCKVSCLLRRPGAGV